MNGATAVLHESNYVVVPRGTYRSYQQIGDTPTNVGLHRVTAAECSVK
jgi:hypothetical protein